MVRAQAGPHYWNRNTYREVGVFFGFLLWLNCTASVWKQNASFGSDRQYSGFGFQLNPKNRNRFARSLRNPFVWGKFRRWDVNFYINDKLLKNWPLKYRVIGFVWSFSWKKSSDRWNSFWKNWWDLIFFAKWWRNYLLNGECTNSLQFPTEILCAVFLL